VLPCCWRCRLGERTSAPERARVATRHGACDRTRDPAGDGSRCYRRVMPGRRVVSGAVVAGLVAAGVAATARAAVRHSRLAAEVRRRLADTTYQRLGGIGTVDELRVLPLVDRRAGRPGLRGEPGVSYLVRAGREVLLFDTGLNLFGRSRSALVDNAEALGVDLTQVPAVVLSHQHDDHVGGVRARRARSFAFSGDPVEPSGLLAYAPVHLTHRSAEVRVTTHERRCLRLASRCSRRYRPRCFGTAGPCWSRRWSSASANSRESQAGTRCRSCETVVFPACSSEPDVPVGRASGSPQGPCRWVGSCPVAVADHGEGMRCPR